MRERLRTLFSLSRLHTRLLLLILMAILPALGLIFCNALEQRKHFALRAQEDAHRLSKIISRDHAEFIESTRQLLVLLAQLPQVLSHDLPSCNLLFTSLLRQHPRYLNLGIIRPDGKLSLSAVPPNGTTDLGDRSYFKRTLQTRDFAIGDYQMGRVTGKPSVNCSYPVFNEAGEIVSVLFVALDLSRLNQFAAQAQLPKGSVLQVIDPNGTIFAHYPDPEKWVGKTLPDHPIMKTILTQEMEGTAEEKGADGSSRLHAFTRLGNSEAGGAYVNIGIPTAVVFAEVNQRLIRNLMGLGLITLLALLAAWVGGKFLILRRINALLSVTKRLAGGDLSVRTGIAYGRGELGQLEQAFDEMAESFERKEAERKQAEEALRESERKYRDLVDHALVGVYKTNLQGEVVYVNDALVRILEYNSPEEMIAGGVIARYKHSKEKERFIQHLKETGHVQSFDAELLTKTGRMKNVLISGTLDGEIISGMIMDITERKQVEEALRESEERYRSLFNDVPVGLYRTTLEGQILDANHALAQLLGYPDRESLLAINTFDTYVDQKVRVQRKVHMDRDGVLRNFEYQLRRCDGTTIWVEGNSKTTLDAEGKVLYYEGTLADITERKKAEQELADLQEQLRQSQKMEAIGRLAGGIAHDFNNLLTVIKGYSQLSLIELKEGDPLRINVEETKKAADRAAELIRQLLAFSRRQIMEMKVIDLNGLLQDLEKMLQRVIGEEIELVTRLTEDLGRIKIDPGQIEQVIMNLAVNAKDAMPNGGNLFIETANTELDEEYARTHIAVIPGRYVRLSVSDTGVGMRPEVRHRVFEPFFTTKEKGKGTGLGLSTVYGIVKQSGGNIWVYSEPDQGTTFKIYLPRVDEPLTESREKILKEELPRGKETILIVEDDEEVRKLAAQILEGQGYKVLRASGGSEALDLFEKKEEPIHLVLSDVVMPGMSGRELAKRFMLIHPKIKVVYMSGYTDHAIVHRGFLEEGVDYVQKPFTVDGLARKVREALDR
ncbi:MAG: hypothetical protein A2W09_05795 [Deltaproteobacteria bacterium RBG_16_50_11]|nr:MAG: hypothetical protein A2W09_05795 [Deltaproteobacteria bacterium RBG_16_50_11]